MYYHGAALACAGCHQESEGHRRGTQRGWKSVTFGHGRYAGRGARFGALREEERSLSLAISRSSKYHMQIHLPGTSIVLRSFNTPILHVGGGGRPCSSSSLLCCAFLRRNKPPKPLRAGFSAGFSDDMAARYGARCG